MCQGIFPSQTHRNCNRWRKKRGRMKISTHRWGWMVNTTPSWIQLKQKQWSLPTAHQHPHPGLKAPSWWTAKPLTSLKVTWDSFLASLIQTDTIVMIMILSYAGWGEEGPGMCAAERWIEKRELALWCSLFWFQKPQEHSRSPSQNKHERVWRKTHLPALRARSP